MTRRCLGLAAAALAAWLATPAVAQAQAVSAPAPTFSRDVAPIVYGKCGICHRPDGGAPFSLLEYEQVRQRATQIAAVTGRRFMPPWKADAESVPFVGQGRLTDAEIALLARWAASGAPEGDRADLPARPTWPKGWLLGTPDLTVTLERPYTLQPEPTDAFRIFAIRLPITETVYVRGVEFHPGNPRVVHHANIRIDRTGTTRRLDDADPQPGYDGLMPRSALYPDGHFLGWTPGQIAPLVDDEMAFAIEPGTDLVVQLHMQPSGAVEQVRPEIGIFFAKAPPRRAPSVLRLGSQGIDIAPGEGAHVIRDEYTLPVDVEVLAVQPHAHYRLRDVRGTATLPDGTERSLIRIADWDFRWQHVYRYQSPIALPKGTRLSMRYVYDNSAENPRNPQQPPVRVFWGQRSVDEMGDLWFQLATKSPADRELLSAEVQRKMTAEDIVGYETMLRVYPADAELHDDVALLYLAEGRAADAVRHFEASTALKPGQAASFFNLGTALTMAGRFDEAIAAYQRALAIAPEYAKAHGNLADTLLALGRTDDAERHYRLAIDADPRAPEAHNNYGFLLLQRGRVPEAVARFRKALDLRPGYAEARYGLGQAARLRGDVAGAAREFRAVTEARPDWAPAHAALAWILATSSTPISKTDANDAVASGQRAVTLTAQQDATALDAFAAALAAAGRFAEAASAARQAVSVANPLMVNEIQERIELYLRRRPYRVPKPEGRPRK
jgi:tetratricopeptide (TPR) repeat protein/mono/diheme cytochrome c family protein